MWRLVSIPMMAMALAVATRAANPSSVQACSPPENFDPVADADVIVEGQFLGFEVVPNPPGSELDKERSVTIRVDMSVTRVLKGASGDVIGIRQVLSLPDPLPEGVGWVGIPSSCGPFGDDPTGKYAVFGLNEREDGLYGGSNATLFFIGDALEGESYKWAIGFVEEGLAGQEPTPVEPVIAPVTIETAPVELPSTGAGTDRSGSTPSFAILAGALSSAALGLAAGAFALRAYRKRAA